MSRLIKATLETAFELVASALLIVLAAFSPAMAQTTPAQAAAAQSAFDKFVSDMRLTSSIYSRVDPLAVELVAQGYKPVVTGIIPEWAFIERIGTIERAQWRERKTLDGQGGSWAADMRTLGAGPQFTLRLLMARGPASPTDRIELSYWALRNYPEGWDSRTEALLAEMSGGPSIDAAALSAALAAIKNSLADAERALSSAK